MDYDADGILDFISGSYDPGDVYLFRGQGQGKYAAVEKLLDEAGVPIAHHPKELAEFNALPANVDRGSNEAIQLRVASFGSWVTPVDWENDGDLDLLIGSFGGQLFRRVNEGTRARPVYASESLPVEADGKPLKVNSHCDPVATDWDGDGLWDLVVGVADGSVGWFRNEGTAEKPRLGAWRELIPAKSDNKFLAQYLEADEVPAPAVRAQICVVDYDGDGLSDILLGDYSDVHRLRDLSEQERADFAGLRAAEAALTKKGDRKGLGVLAEKKKDYLADEEGKRTSHVWFYRRLPRASGSTSGPSAQASTRAVPPSKSEGPIELRTELTRSSAGHLTLSVCFEIAPGWHLYADLPKDSGLRRVEVRPTWPEGVTATDEGSPPESVVSLQDPRTRIYEDSVSWDWSLKLAPGAAGSTIAIDVTYQACNESGCLPPQKRTLKVTLPDASRSDDRPRRDG